MNEKALARWGVAVAPPPPKKGNKNLVINKPLIYLELLIIFCRSQWPRGVRRRSTAARLLRLWVRIPPGAWMFFCCECCVLSGRGLCDELITRRPEEPYRLWCVVVCDLEISRMRRPWPALGRSATGKKSNYILHDGIWPLNRWSDGELADIISCRLQYRLILE